jgi:hypothetical protein
MRAFTVLGAAALIASPLLMAQTAPAATVASTTVQLDEPGEAAIDLSAQCRGCSWEVAGREGAVLQLTIDGRYSQHVMVSRGDDTLVYPLTLGPLAAGAHQLALSVDSAGMTMTAEVTASFGALDVVTAGSREYAARAHSPLIYARPGTVSRFSDIPLLMWYGVETSPRGQWIRYSVIFSNEDGGTASDKLMARWGRLSDIEYVYGVELDATGRVLTEELQGPEHRFVPFTGAKIGSHPVMYDVTDNNMVSDRGVETQLFALKPISFELRDATREAVMDEFPWTYRVSSQEATREGRVDPAAKPGSRMVADPRRFVYVEACAQLENASIAYDAGFDDKDGVRTWVPADGGLADFRIELEGDRLNIERPGGCFQSAVAAPADAGSLRALRWHAHALHRDRPAGAARARLIRVNRVFRLDEHYHPNMSLFAWKDGVELAVDGTPTEMALPQR